ncbi:MAG TPA: aspartyl protease family protein [Acidobacteriota bacterium]|nr:aspartyl protease family protein [Acidobacteriota bacterium]
MDEPDFRPADAEEARPSRRRVILFLLVPAVAALALLLWLRFNLRAAGQVSVEALDSAPSFQPAPPTDYADCWQAVREFRLKAYADCVQTPVQKVMAQALEDFYQARYPESDQGFQQVLQDAQAPQDLRRRAFRAWAESLLMRELWMEYRDAMVYFPSLARESGLDPDGDVLARAFMGKPGQKIDFPPQGNARTALSQALTGQPQVEVKINGRSYDFLLDTGASLSVLSSTVAEEAGVEPASQVSGNVNDVEEIRFFPALVPELEMGSLRVRNLPVAIIDSEHLSFGLAGIDLLKVDGILGWTLIRRLRIELDLRQGTARFSPPAPPTTQRNVFWSGCPMVLLHTQDGTPALLGIDTGAQSSEIRSRLIRRLGLASQGDSHLSIGVGRRQRVTVQTVQDLDLILGRHRLHFDSISTGEGLLALFFIDPDGQLGFNIAYKTGLTLDFTSGRLDLGVSSN